MGGRIPAYLEIDTRSRTLPNNMATVSEGCAPTDNQYFMRSNKLVGIKTHLTDI